MKKLLITGATGFIGSHLAELCVQKGYNVVAFDRYNTNNHWGWLEGSEYKDDLEVILGDIRDYDSVSKAMAGCSAVFHLAALIGIPYSYVSPLAYIRTNVEGTYNVLESVKNLGLNQVLITKTIRKHIPFARIHYISNPDIFIKFSGKIISRICLRIGAAAVIIDERLLKKRSIPLSLVWHPMPILYKSHTLEEDQIGTIYSEEVVLGY